MSLEDVLDILVFHRSQESPVEGSGRKKGYVFKETIVEVMNL